MRFNRSRKVVGATLAAAVIIGGGVATVAPAAADDVAQYAATNWKKVWKQKIKKYADTRYYTKAQSDAKYSTKAETAGALANYYTKGQSDANYYSKSQSDANYYTKSQSDANYYTKSQSDAAYAAKGSSYSKAESDARYAPYPKLIRGTFNLGDTAAAAGSFVGDNVTFGDTLSAPAVTHYIKLGAAVPAGCSGTAAAPNADPGHLCVFESYVFGPIGATANKGVCSITYNCGTSSTMGALVYGYSTGAGLVAAAGSWAVRPAALAPVTVAGNEGPNAGAPAAVEPGQ
jgi:hypothetical protein